MTARELISHRSGYRHGQQVWSVLLQTEGSRVRSTDTKYQVAMSPRLYGWDIEGWCSR